MCFVSPVSCETLSVFPSRRCVIGPEDPFGRRAGVLEEVRNPAVSPERASGVLEINLEDLVANWRQLRKRVAPAACAAVVKADAYGTGLTEAGKALAAAGCDTFFVAVPSEGVALRAKCPSATIYVLNGLAMGLAELYLAHRLRPVLGSLAEIREWQAALGAADNDGSAALHVDTGMNRLGLSLAEFASLMSASSKAALGFAPSLVMSHFVMADNPDHPLNARQIRDFAQARALCPDIPASLANSSGIFLARDARHDLARPGYALFGGNPTPGRENPMRDVVTLKVPIVQLRVIQNGETVGYDAQWTAPGRRRIATLSAGYADGYPRGGTVTDARRESGAPIAEAIIAGKRCPFAGRVSMDLITVDVTGLPEDAVKPGDPAILIGEGLSLDEVGQRADTIGYEILTRLGRRFERVYRR
ncbi:MAG: alanine racemase [Hyphomicrobiales bacterium]|nr:alanine racemase [Hyphomicrobiales bacterium]